METDYEFDDPTKWAKDPAGRTGHALHLTSGDVVSLDEDTYRWLFRRRKKSQGDPLPIETPVIDGAAQATETLDEGVAEETEPIETPVIDEAAEASAETQSA